MAKRSNIHPRTCCCCRFTFNCCFAIETVDFLWHSWACMRAFAVVSTLKAMIVWRSPLSCLFVWISCKASSIWNSASIRIRSALDTVAREKKCSSVNGHITVKLKLRRSVSPSSSVWPYRWLEPSEKSEPLSVTPAVERSQEINNEARTLNCHVRRGSKTNDLSSSFVLVSISKTKADSSQSSSIRSPLSQLKLLPTTPGFPRAKRLSDGGNLLYFVHDEVKRRLIWCEIA